MFNKQKIFARFRHIDIPQNVEVEEKQEEDTTDTIPIRY